MKVVVLQLDYHDEKCQKKIMSTVIDHSGIESFKWVKKDKKLTLNGNIDPVKLVIELRKLCKTNILSVETSKAPPKMKVVKKDEPKKERPEEGKKG